jgi:hypothetical protein
MMDHNQGFTWSHWKPPLGEYTHGIAPAATMVIDGGDTTNTTEKPTFS